MRLRPVLVLSTVLLLAGGLAGCGSDDGSGAESASGATIVVTTSILGDVVSHLVGDLAAVEVLMPAGADPHDFALSARQVADLRGADAVIANGAGFEQGLLDALDAAEADGVPVHEAISTVDTLASDGASADLDASDAGAVDPHFFTDPDRMAVAAEGVVTFLSAAVPALGDLDLAGHAEPYLDQLRALGDEIDATLAPIPAADRVLVTNHEVFAYFAERFSFEVVGAIIPGGGTQGSADAQSLSALARTIEGEDVPAVFADVSSSTDLAEALAAEVGREVEVVSLFTESLGEPGSGAETYLAMVRTNAERIVAALT